MAITNIFNGAAIVRPGSYGSPYRKKQAKVFNDRKHHITVERQPGETDDELRERLKLLIKEKVAIEAIKKAIEED